MKGALIHGVLLLVMLVYGYRTWTRDKTVKPDLGNVVLWDKSEKDIVSIAYKGEMREVKLEQKTANGETYWWGADTQITKTPKPTPPKPPEPPKDAGSAAGSGSAAPPPTPGSGAAGSNAGSGSGSAVAAGSGSGSGSAAKPPEPPKQEFDEKRTTREFPLGDGGMKIVKSYTSARAIRDLGSINDENKKKYKLDTTKAEVSVTFKDGSTRTFKLGEAVYGNQDKYAVDDKGRGYVLSKDMLTNLELGETSLYLSDPRGFDLKKIEGVVIEGAGKVKTGIRTETEVEGRKVKTWADGETKKPHPSLGNFIDQIGAMPPTEYSTKTKLDALTPIVKVTYKDGSGAKLGSLTLLKGEKPPTLPEGGITDPANPPKGETAYYVMTEKSHVPALVRTDTAQQVETNLPVVMNEKPPEPGKSVDPKGNPFGNGPLPPTGPSGGSAGMPPGHGMPPGMGGDPHGAPPPGGDPHGAPAPGGDPHGLPPAPAGGSAAAPTSPAGGAAAPKAPAGGSAVAPKAPAAAPKAPAAGSAAAAKAPAAGSAAAKAPAASKAPAPKPAGSAAAPAAGSAK